MYLIINGDKYSVSKREVTDDSIKYFSVTPEPVEIGDVIEMYRDDGFLLSVDNPSNYIKCEYTGTLLVLTNNPNYSYSIGRTLSQRVSALEESIMKGLGI